MDKIQKQLESEFKFWSDFIKNLNSIPDIANLKEDCPDASFFKSQGYDELIKSAKRRLNKIEKELLI